MPKGNKKRKVYLLMQDGSVKKSSHSVSKLRSLGAIENAKWVLIPIYKTQCTYIAVDADTILDMDFTSANLRYHMKYKTVERGAHNAPFEATIYDYYTVESDVTDIDTFYNAIYNIMAFRYFKELYANSDGIDEYWFIDVPDLAITFYHGKKKASSICIRAEQDVDSIPFNYSPMDEMSAKIASNFGLLGANDWINLKNLTISYDDHGKLKWEFNRENIQLFTRVHMVGIGNSFTKSFTLLKSKDYDACIAIESVAIYVAPIDLTGLDVSFLPICYKYGAPLYECRYNDERIDAPSTLIFHDMSERVAEVFSYESIADEEFAVFLDNLEYLFQVFTEGVRIHILGSDSQEDDEVTISKLMTSATVLVNMELTLTALECPATTPLSINTDTYEDIKPTIRDVCKLIRVNDKMRGR